MFKIDSQLRRNRPQIIVATPGRLVDLIMNFGLSIENSKYCILDEGDRMLDMGFQKELDMIKSYMERA